MPIEIDPRTLPVLIPGRKFRRGKAWKYHRAAELRRDMTWGERCLWDYLRDERLGVKFQPQEVILGYITDFYCHQLRLVIEVDGPHHAQQTAYDATRDHAMLSRGGVTTIRFDVELIRRSEQSVIDEIRAIVADRKLVYAIIKRPKKKLDRDRQKRRFKRERRAVAKRAALLGAPRSHAVVGSPGR